MTRQILIAFATFLMTSCSSNQGKKHPRTFYNNIAGWDISYIPIIQPYRASSLDKGITWSINRPEVVNSFQVKSFGVSHNFIYGQRMANWFLLDTKSKLYAEYQTEEELMNALKSFAVPLTAVRDCNFYFDCLAKGKVLYWFPTDGKTYPNHPDIIPDHVTTINVTSDNQQPDFRFKENLPFKKNKVYFFKVNYKKKDNDLYYLSFNNSPPILVKDSLLIPVFNDNNQFEITLYTPYPVAQEKGIPEEKRFHKSKTIYIR